MLSTRRGLVAGGLVMTALLVGVAGLVAVNAMARQTVREEHIYAFSGKTVSIDAVIGDVHIVPGKAGQLGVARRLTYGLRRPFVEELIDGDVFRVADRPCNAAFDCEVRWLLQVPRDVDVDVTTRSGSINVSGMSNTVKLVTETGSVRVDAPSGKLLTIRTKTGMVKAQNIRSEQVVATSSTGEVSLTFRAPPSLVVGRSDGNVGIELPDGHETYRIEAKAENGSRTVPAIDDPGSRRRINVRSSEGNVSVIQNPPDRDREPAG